MNTVKVFDLEDTPVSHDQALKKQVLVPEGLSCVRHISHIRLGPGSSASPHSHDVYEVFYCISGGLEFSVGGQAVRARAGVCLIVEPGETHSITRVLETSELLYLHVS